MRHRILARVVMSMAIGVSLAACSNDRPVANAGAVLPFDDHDPVSRSVHDEGLRMRAAIDRFYLERPHPETYREPQPRLQHVVEGFLPIGMPFARAEAILRHAGFTVNRSRDDDPCAYARIAPYARTFPYTDLGITLRPAGDTDKVAHPTALDRTIVRDVSAGFIKTWP